MRRFSLLAVLVSAAMLSALAISATSASAANLCKIQSITCQPGDTYPLGTQFHANLTAGKRVVIYSQEGHVLNQCTSGSFDATTTKVISADTLEGKANQFVLGGCGQSVKVTWDAGDWATWKVGPERFTTLPIIEFTTPKSYGIEIPCRYQLYGPGKLSGGNKLVYTEVMMGSGGRSGELDFLCPGKVVFTGTFDITTPTPAYVAY